MPRRSRSRLEVWQEAIGKRSPAGMGWMPRAPAPGAGDCLLDADVLRPSANVRGNPGKRPRRRLRDESGQRCLDPGLVTLSGPQL
jgi:hypothetical protein